MLELSADEVAAYLNFFPRFEEAVQKSWAARNPKASKGLSALKILEDLDPSLKREYQKARSGEIWFNLRLYQRAKRDLDFRIIDLDLQERVDSAAAAYDRVSQTFKYGRSSSWGATSIAKAAQQARAIALLGSTDRNAIFEDRLRFSEFADRLINATAAGGNHGEAINNAYVLSEYMMQQHQSEYEFFSSPDFVERLVQVTRAGAWISQSVGQWYRFRYFQSMTNKLVQERYVVAGIVSHEHNRHWERRNRLINDTPEFGSATKALALSIEEYGLTSELIDPVLFLNAADEFLERGYPSHTYPLLLAGMNLKQILDEAEARLRQPGHSLGLRMSHMTLTASRLMNDGDYDGAERQIVDAGLGLPFDLSSGQEHIQRGLRLVRGKLALLRGQVNNYYLESSRQICLKMGAFHKVREIDRLRQVGDIERPF